MINYRFLNYKHYKTFQDELDQISDDSIVFIQDECCIWARGQLYRCGGGSGTATLDSHTLNFVDDHGNLEFTIMQDGNDLVLKDGKGNESRASYVLEGDLHAVAYSGSYNDLKDKPTQHAVRYKLVTLTTAEYEALVNVNQVEDDTYYFTYEADGGWTFGGRFPITLS